MTNAEAIETLRANYPDACYEQLREAVDAAIDALKAQDARGQTMYDDLVKRLREHNGWALNETLDEAADAIEELMRRCEQFQYMPPPAWIPVTERLPEIDMDYPHHEDYLVQYDSGNMDVASWSNVNRFWTDHVTEPHWNCVQFAEVIAWMPLPEPWKEAER